MNTNRAAGYNSIQTKLIVLIAAMLLLVMGLNLYIYSQIGSMVRKIDSVFSSNVTIGELSDTLEMVQDNVYEYLNTKSSEALENYYRYSQVYTDLLDQLNGRSVDSPIMMLEKNIRGMSESYLEKADETVQAKRGRNVERYKAAFEEQNQLYQYINHYIYELNQRQFERNSENYQFLISTMKVLETASLVIILLIFGLSLGAAVLMIRTMIKPLTRLSEAAHQVAEGNFDVEVPVVDTDDEIGIVTKTFDQMLASIRAYIVRIRSSLETEARMKEQELSMEANLKEAQLKFLQAQINPHFLFNSLNAGAQLAMMEDAEATGVFLEKMADFFRYNVKKTDGGSTLEEEIELVDNYIYILNVRFAGDITYKKIIAEDTGNPVMPGMILQPLVENAVSHGIHDKMDEGEITLAVERDDEGLQITVTDNGSGMSKEQIQAVLSGDMADREEDSEGSTGIGLKNVRNRLSLYYGRDDLLNIYSEGIGRGTTVMVFLPTPDGETALE